jgi:fumarate reductase subunit C
MNDESSHTYTPYHPRWFRPHVSTYWWLSRRAYLAFILRELSSIFVAWFVVYLLLLIRAASRGEGAYQQFLTWSAHPAMLLLNVITLGFLVYHAITWFNLAPQAMVVHVRGRRLPARAITAANYAAWIVGSLAIGWLVLGASG